MHLLAMHHVVCILMFSALNLAEQCLNVDFMRQMRSLGLVKKSLLLLKDSQTQPVSILFLFNLFVCVYVSIGP